MNNGVQNAGLSNVNGNNSLSNANWNVSGRATCVYYSQKIIEDFICLKMEFYFVAKPINGVSFSIYPRYCTILAEAKIESRKPWFGRL